MHMTWRRFACCTVGAVQSSELQSRCIEQRGRDGMLGDAQRTLVDDWLVDPQGWAVMANSGAR